MKSPSSYGSENEESRFIRHVTAPDRVNHNRHQKKRLTIAGASFCLLAASAGVGYTTMKNFNSTVKTTTLKADAAFVSKLGDAFHPYFDKIDHDQDGTLSLEEVLADLNEKESVDVDKVKASHLASDIKTNVLALLGAKLESDTDCAKQASEKREFPVTKKDYETFYYLLDVFCPRVTIAVTRPDEEEEENVVSDNSQQQIVEIPTPNGGTTKVIIVGDPVEGKQTIAIPDGDGGYSTTQFRSIETLTGQQKILIPDSQGHITPVVIPEVPEKVKQQAQHIGKQPQVVNVVTLTGETEQVIRIGDPENGKQVVEIIDESGKITTTEVKVEETPSGVDKIDIPTDNGYVDVEFPNKPARFDHTEELPGENGGYHGEEAQDNSKWMTKVEFRDWITKHYADNIALLDAMAQQLKDDELAKTSRVKKFDDCIEQAANKFGYYGVYEQAPHFQNAVDWVQNVCWAEGSETPSENPLLRR